MSTIDAGWQCDRRSHPTPHATVNISSYALVLRCLKATVSLQRPISVSVDRVSLFEPAVWDAITDDHGLV